MGQLPARSGTEGAKPSLKGAKSGMALTLDVK